jgi:peroxiredoxin
MLPKLVVYNTNGNEVSINDITKNNIAVIYFWPKELGKIEMLHEKLIILKKEYPNVLFIGIERNKNQSDWKGFIESKHLAKNKQFNLSKSSENYSWFEGNTARTIIINDQGNVENAYLFFNNKYFENHLKKFKKH